MARSDPEVLRRPTLTPGEDAALRLCDSPGCEHTGLHRAPKDRSRLDDYYWFCIEHAQAYNRTWDFCAGFDENEIEAMIRRSSTWDRPTWPFAGDSRGGAGKTTTWRHVSDPFGVFGLGLPDSGFGSEAPPHDLPKTVAEGLATLDLDQHVTVDQIKRRYKRLVKQLHPDTNGGSKSGEEKFKTVTAAYATLMLWLGAVPARD
jgi:hypothetical protein